MVKGLCERSNCINKGKTVELLAGWDGHTGQYINVCDDCYYGRSDSPCKGCDHMRDPHVNDGKCTVTGCHCSEYTTGE